MKSVKRARNLIVLMIIAALVVVVFVLLWWIGRDDAPPAVDIQSAVAQLEEAEGSTSGTVGSGITSDNTDTDSSGQATADGDGEATASTETAAAPSAESDAGIATTAGADDAEDTSTVSTVNTAGAGLAGVWEVMASGGVVELTEQPAVSFAGFRVDEVLAGGIGDFTAVGRTPDVSGWIELSDTEVLAAEISVDLATLRTDNSMRDGQIQRALGTSEFPFATFSLIEPVTYSADSDVSATVHGTLSVKGVTNQVDFTIDARLVDNTIVVVGSAPVTFADYGVTVPSVPVVVSVENHGVIEFQLFFTR